MDIQVYREYVGMHVPTSPAVSLAISKECSPGCFYCQTIRDLISAGF